MRKRSVLLMGLVLVVLIGFTGCPIFQAYVNRHAPSDIATNVVDNGDETYSVSVVWTNNSGGKEDGILLERTTTEGVWDEATEFDLGPGSTGYDDLEVQNGMTYWYRVSAVWRDGEYRLNPEQVARAVIPGGEVVLPPEAPFISATVGHDTEGPYVFLEWTNVANESGYHVYISVNAGTTEALTSPAADTSDYTDRSISDGDNVEYYIVAWNSGGNSPDSNVVGVFVEPVENPEATAYLDTTAQDGRSVRQILADEGFAVNFGTAPPNVVGVYDFERNNGGVISTFEAELANQLGIYVDYSWTDGGDVLNFPNSLITGTGNTFTLWYVTDNGTASSMYIQTCVLDMSGTISSNTTRIYISGPVFILEHYVDTLTPQSP